MNKTQRQSKINSILDVLRQGEVSWRYVEYELSENDMLITLDELRLISEILNRSFEDLRWKLLLYLDIPEEVKRVIRNQSNKIK